MRTVLRIHDSLVWIRIQIHGSMPLTNGSGSGFGSSYFRHWPSQDANKKNFFFFKFFCLLLFEGTLTSFFKDKKSKRSHKAVGIKFIFYYFCLLVEGSGSIRLSNESGSGSRRPKNIRIRNTGWGSRACLVCRVEGAQHQGEFWLPVSDSVHHCVL